MEFIESLPPEASLRFPPRGEGNSRRQLPSCDMAGRSLGLTMNSTIDQSSMRSVVAASARSCGILAARSAAEMESAAGAGDLNG